VVVRGKEIEIHTAEAAAFWVDLGRLRGTGQSATVTVVELDLRSAGRRRGLIETPRDTAVVWSGTVPKASVLVLNRPSPSASWSADWTAAAPVPADSTDVVVGELTDEAQEEVFAVGLAQSAGGYLLAEAYRELVGADLGIAMAREVRSSLPAGPVTRGHLLDFVRSEDVRLVSWTLSGAQVKGLLEALLEQAVRESFVSPQFTGFTATVDLSQPRGGRVLQLSLAPERTYRVVTLDRYAGWFHALFSGKEAGGRRSRWFGPPEAGGEVWPDQVDHARSPVQAVEAFLNRHRPYTPVEEPSLIVAH
jgi:2',3'-cyclic-nucleotide 2'-phosphodiesterase (5'-nucleotidase family)